MGAVVGTAWAEFGWKKVLELLGEESERKAKANLQLTLTVYRCFFLVFLIVFGFNPLLSLLCLLSN